MVILSTILRAIYRARWSILAVAVTYFLSVAVGMIMVHTGNTFALDYRDNLIARANASDASLIALDQGNRLQAGLIDFGGNLLGGVSNTLGGMGVVFPFPFIAFRGWVGGIVSVDGAHISRLSNSGEAFYYLTTLILQLIPYSLAGGIGVNAGVAYFRHRPPYDGASWLGLPVEAVKDVFRVYLLVVPLFLVASLFEFLAR